jgi:NADH-quinone oxidoreductase subunit E
MKAKITKAEAFVFNAANKAWADGQIAKYPDGREQSAVMPLLTRAQEQHGGWLTIPAIEHVAEYLGMHVMRVMEVATFYSMYRLKPVGKHVIEICTTTPCWLRGSNDIVAAAEDELGIKMGETTADGNFTLFEVECAGACVNAPVAAIHKYYYEDLTPQSMKDIISELKAGNMPKAGPQVDRLTSAPVDGMTTLQSLEGGK